VKFKAAAVQLKIAEGEPAINHQKVKKAVAEAAKNSAQLIVLPETWTAGFGPSVNDPMAFAEKEDGESVNLMSNLAKKHGIYLVGGSIPELEDGHIYNTVFLFGPKGEKIGRYRKIHLFLDSEANSFRPGFETPVFETDLGKLAVTTCYDIRFPELARYYALKGAEIITVPSNFTTRIAEDFPRPKIHHWAYLLLARAIENQVYVVAANCTGHEKSNYFGHSLIIDPWGEILDKAGYDERILYGEIDLQLVSEIRTKMPVLKNIQPGLLEKLKSV